MTQHDRISAYIDNELSGEAEQDFLISLASSDMLRKSFRSELVLKNVIHRDEVLTEPSRDLRPAILGIIGIGAAVTASETAEAATVTGTSATTGLKALFATKLNTLITASLISVSAIGGYAVKTAITPEAPIAEHQTVSTTKMPTDLIRQTIEIPTPASTIEAEKPATLLSAPQKTTASKSAAKPSVKQSEPLGDPINVVGSNTVNITTKKK